MTGITFWLLPASLILLSSLLAIGGETAFLNFRYDRDAIANGAAWRLISGHFVHLSWGHFFLNMAGLGLVWLLVGRALGTGQWLLGTVILVIGIDVGFWWLDPNLGWYVGLSGLLHGVLVAGLYSGIRERDKESIVLLCFVLAKLAWEQFSGGPLPGSEATSGGTVIVNAHLYGTVGGVLAGALLMRRAKPPAAI